MLSAAPAPHPRAHPRSCLVHVHPARYCPCSSAARAPVLPVLQCCSAARAAVLPVLHLALTQASCVGTPTGTVPGVRAGSGTCLPPSVWRPTPSRRGRPSPPCKMWRGVARGRMTWSPQGGACPCHAWTPSPTASGVSTQSCSVVLAVAGVVSTRLCWPCDPRPPSTTLATLWLSSFWSCPRCSPVL